MNLLGRFNQVTQPEMSVLLAGMILNLIAKIRYEFYNTACRIPALENPAQPRTESGNKLELRDI